VVSTGEAALFSDCTISAAGQSGQGAGVVRVRAMYLLLEHIVVVLGVLAVAVAMILALQQRRSPQSSAAWILFIILVPYVAVPVFLVLGFRKQGRRFDPIRFSQPPQPGAGEAAGLFTRLGASAVTGGNRLVLQDDPAAAQAALDEVIAGATGRLDALLYIVADDDSGRRFVQQLAQKAASGVAVRLGIDWLGSLHRPRRDLAAFVRAGGEVRYFSPLRRLRDSGRLNLRNHRKMVIADGARVWAGGRNVGEDYLASPPGVWRDLSFTASGPVVRAYADVFSADWHMTGPAAPEPPPPPPPAGDSVLQLVPAGPDEALDALHDGLVSAIHRADRRIWLATPYFVPTEALSLSLVTAARRGVEVRLILPATSNQWTADLARGAYLHEAAQAGCRICRYGPGMMHAKAGLIDDMGWVGSANFDVRSMLLNFETALMIYDRPTVAVLERWFETLMPDCVEGAEPSGLPRRILEGIFRLGAPIL
jgi:cardiolipin synthase